MDILYYIGNVCMVQNIEVFMDGPITAKQANDVVASERSIFSKNHDYKSFFCVAVYLYFGIYMCVVAENYKQTDTHTHTHMGQLQ